MVRTFLNEKDELVHVQVGDETITCTTEHSFYVHDKGWVAAIDLKPHDQLELRNGKASFVHSIRIEKLDQPIQVYNFEVEDFHTYFVGENCVLVHNMCKNPGRTKKQARLRELADDDKLSSALRGEIKRDMNAIARGTRKTIRVPTGYEMAHRIGYEARNGYSYLYSDLNIIRQHRLHHKIF